MKTKTHVRAVAALLVALLPLSACAGMRQATKLSPIRIKGTQVVTDQGKTIRLRGVNVASMEWSSDGEGHVLDTVRVAIKDWNANIIRLPMSQDRWFGQAPEQSDKGAAYRALIRKIVDYCEANRCYVILDLHWNDADVWGKSIGQHVMPDMNSVTFWRDCARTYRNSPAVLFDLYNEPHDTTWDIWLKGGDITEKTGPGARQGRFTPVTYKTPGMQALLDTIRSTGAMNVVLAGGLDWSYDLSGFLKGYTLKDPEGRGVLYVCHNYPFKGDTVEKWLAKLDAALPKIPLIMSEFGAQNRGATVDQPNPWLERVLKEMEARKCNWTAWDLHPAAGPTLISDWKYTPTPSFGALVKAALAKR